MLCHIYDLCLYFFVSMYRYCSTNDDDIYLLFNILTWLILEHNAYTVFSKMNILKSKTKMYTCVIQR